MNNYPTNESLELMTMRIIARNLSQKNKELVAENEELRNEVETIANQYDELFNEYTALAETLSEYEEEFDNRQAHFVAVSTNLEYCFPLFSETSLSAAEELKQICLAKRLPVALFKVFSEEDMC